jgi:sulfur carrier protein
MLSVMYVNAKRHAQAVAREHTDMHVTAEVVGRGTHELDLAGNATYTDLLHAVELSPHEATVLVEGTPVPEDREVDTEQVQVLRLIKGG